MAPKTLAYFQRKIAKAMKDDTEFGQNFRSAVNGFLTKINRMTKARRLSWVFRSHFESFPLI